MPGLCELSTLDLSIGDIAQCIIDSISRLVWEHSFVR